MQYDFDTVHDRRNTNCIKYDAALLRGKPENVLPMWVADMDFRTADPIVGRLEAAAAHGIFGYSSPGYGYYEAVLGWYRRHHSLDVRKEWLVQTPGVVFAIAQAIQAFTVPGDSIMVNEPVYYPFMSEIRQNGRKSVSSDLEYRDGKYCLNPEDIEKKITEEKVKLYILCSPHNPVGRVWTEEELENVAEICLRHGVLLISDEIHSDFIWPGHRHISLLALDEKYRGNAIVCTSPSKTFNLAGLQVSNIMIPDENLRNRFRASISACGYSEMNCFGIAAGQAAYEEGDEWYAQLMRYLKGNLDYFRTYLKEKMPEIELTEPEGTYLLWADFRKLGMKEPELEKFVLEKAGLWLDSGYIFGNSGTGFERFNIACPRSVLEKALTQLSGVLQGIQ